MGIFHQIGKATDAVVDNFNNMPLSTKKRLIRLGVSLPFYTGLGFMFTSLMLTDYPWSSRLIVLSCGIFLVTSAMHQYSSCTRFLSNNVPDAEANQYVRLQHGVGLSATEAPRAILPLHSVSTSENGNLDLTAEGSGTNVKRTKTPKRSLQA